MKNHLIRNIFAIMPQWALYGIIVAVVCVIAAVVFVIIRKNKKKKDMDTLIDNRIEDNPTPEINVEVDINEEINLLKTKYEAKLQEFHEIQELADGYVAQIKDLQTQIANRDAMIERLYNESRADRDVVMSKIIGLGDRLVEQLSKLSPEAFNGNCGTIVNGAKNFVAMLKEKMHSEQWYDLKTAECLAELRAMGVSLIEAGTNSWVNLLGRLYSYMSVPELEMRLSEEGVDFEKVTEIYLTVGAIFASFGMVIYNCSPGFDSANDKATNYMFQHKSSIDRITRWLDGEEAVKEAVPNHGHTVYDFGQLAYITVDDTNIHQGCVMFYNE